MEDSRREYIIYGVNIIYKTLIVLLNFIIYLYNINYFLTPDKLDNKCKLFEHGWSIR